MDWIWIILALLVGLAAGAAAAYAVMKRRHGDRESVAELRREYDRYKGKVTEHFVETADLVNTLTRSYKRVYDHLESGAYSLVGEETLRKRLDAPDEAPVMIEYLGQRRAEPGAPARNPDETPVRPEGPVTAGAPPEEGDLDSHRPSLSSTGGSDAAAGGSGAASTQTRGRPRRSAGASSTETPSSRDEGERETDRSDDQDGAEERTRSAG